MTKFVFEGATDQQVSWGNGKDPRDYFGIGDILSLEKREIHRWYTKLYFIEVPDIGFNSVCFKELTKG